MCGVSEILTFMTVVCEILAFMEVVRDILALMSYTAEVDFNLTGSGERGKRLWLW